MSLKRNKNDLINIQYEYRAIKMNEVTAHIIWSWKNLIRKVWHLFWHH